MTGPATPDVAPDVAPDAEHDADERTEVLVANLLRAGVLFAALVTALGGAALLIDDRATTADYHRFGRGPVEWRSLAAIVTGAVHLHPAAVTQLGLVLLIATPIARVVLTLVAFVLRRDRLYTVVTAIVLAVLLYSLVLSG